LKCFPSLSMRVPTMVFLTECHLPLNTTIVSNDWEEAEGRVLRKLRRSVRNG
jgi:hypothetical protein